MQIDITSENPETTTVSGFFSSLNFQVGKIDTSPSPRGVRPDLNLITERFGQILIKYNKGPVDGTIERSGGLNDLL